MKKSLNIYNRIVEESDKGFFTIYFLDIDAGSYEEVMRIDESIIHPEGDPASEFFTEIEIFDKIQAHLVPGVYFCVSRNSFGSDCFTRDTRKSSVESHAIQNKIT